ncbi:ArsR/SmtB family transcription factor [Nocardia wallacei]|uniref:Transcriptional regulator n=2 Tax=Nocardia wallacei TaxID=480035 RepID=A0A7G1KHD8_9NOCA|nr:metalloregulator ArsR/SmtB family transcription factor [Nocardia wallacei]BCK54722.1 transcriptional regulator [Nocardia wallacei]
MGQSPAQVFEALADPVRRDILELVAAAELSAGAIVTAVQRYTRISQPGVSQHLKVLRDAGLVRMRADGTRRLYALDRAGLETARAWLAELADPLAAFAQPLDALATEVARGKRTRRAAAHGAPEAQDANVRRDDHPNRDTRPA